MDSKLTLKMDSSVISAMKKYAENEGKSISKIVENFFRKLTTNSDDIKVSPLVKELSGIISESDFQDSDYIDYLEKKYE